MSFTKVVENFTCEHCGSVVVGGGYTNHCPMCLWSKHVDNDPGDRAAACAGMMAPLRLEGSSPHYRIVHVCQKCGVEKIVDTAPADRHDALVKLAGRRDIA